MSPTTLSRRIEMNRQMHRELLRDLEAGRGQPTADERRGAGRHHFPVADIPVSIEQPQGGSIDWLMYGRNIAERGISLLHGAFVHAGSRCVVHLERQDGNKLRATGEVAYCRLVGGTCHEIGIRFAEEIDTGALRGTGASIERSESRAVAVTEKQVSPLSGRVLVADSFAPDLNLLVRGLSEKGLDVLQATTPGAALDAVKRAKPDLVLFGMSVGGDEGARTVAAIRTAGFEEPILVMSADTNAAALEQVQRAGANAIVSKPINFDLLTARLHAYLGDLNVPDRVSSTAIESMGMGPLISRYVEHTRRTAELLKLAYNERRWPELIALCVQLKGSGCSYGFNHLTICAITALDAFAEDPLSKRARESLAILIRCCRVLEGGQDASEAA